MNQWKNSINKKVDDEVIFVIEYAGHIYKPLISHFAAKYSLPSRIKARNKTKKHLICPTL